MLKITIQFKCYSRITTKPERINSAAMIFCLVIFSLKIRAPIKNANKMDVSLNAATKGIDAFVIAQIATQYDKKENTPAADPTLHVLSGILITINPFKTIAKGMKTGTVKMNNQAIYDVAFSEILAPMPSDKV